MQIAKKSWWAHLTKFNKSRNIRGVKPRKENLGGLIEQRMYISSPKNVALLDNKKL